MAILERQIQKIYPGKWEELEKLDKENTMFEERHGWPTKTRYTCISGTHDQGTLVVERLWDSMAVWEQAVLKIQDDPEFKGLDEKAIEIIESVKMEILWKLE